MALAPYEEYLRLLPALAEVPGRAIWVSYDEEADVLYVNFRRPAVADGGDEIAEDVIARTSGGEIIGYTILNASHHAASVSE